MAAPFLSIPNRIGMPRIREEEHHPDRGKGHRSQAIRRRRAYRQGKRATGEGADHGAAKECSAVVVNEGEQRRARPLVSLSLLLESEGEVD